MIAVLQPHIPHYREEFFKGITEQFDTEFFCYENENVVKKNNFSSSTKLRITHIPSKSKGPVLIYNPLVLLKSKYSTLVLMLHFGHLTTWFLLLTKFIHGKRIILFGHGISVKRYISEAKSPDFRLKFMIFLSDGVWFYTDTELTIWKSIFPNKDMVALNNTISDIDQIVKTPQVKKSVLRTQFKISQEVVLIFCARFNNEFRRTDLLLEAIQRLDYNRFAFVIIGSGELKPDFSKYKNVYDFGEVYDRILKDELFQLSDVYFQPGWVGLSIVEAMAYGKPIFTLKRSSTILQCVEYGYIKNGFNGLVFNNVDEFVNKINENCIITEIEILGRNAMNFASNEISMRQMISNACSILP